MGVERRFESSRSAIWFIHLPWVRVTRTRALTSPLPFNSIQFNIPSHTTTTYNFPLPPLSLSLSFPFFMTPTATAASTSTTTSTTTITSTPLSPSPLQHATTNSTIAWQTDLEALFHRSKDRFPDVVWALLTEEDGEPTGEQVYGHKGGPAISISRIPLRDSSYQPLLTHPHPSLLLSSVPYHPVHLSSLIRALTYTRLQQSYTLVLPQASRPGIFPFGLPLYYPQGPWIHILHQGFPPSPLSLFPLVQKSPPYPDPLRPFALHPPSLKIKMA